MEDNQPSWLRTAENFSEGEGGLEAFPTLSSHTITLDSGILFSYLNHHLAIDQFGDDAWRSQLGDGFYIGSGGLPSLVSDATGTIYAYALGGTGLGEPSENHETSQQVLRLSNDGTIADAYEIDDSWTYIRPIAIGVEQTLLLSATQVICDDPKQCTQTNYLMAINE